MTINKKDFVEIEFTGKVKDTGEIFDSNIKEDLEKANLQNAHAKPFIFAVGEGMFLEGIDEFLEGKPDTPESYEVELAPEKAFGKRDPKLTQIIPMKVFREQRLNPVPGAMFNFDGRIAKILSVSGGRVIADFNNPIAGKDVVYNINFKRKIEDLNEKAKAFIDFLFRKDYNFEIKDKKLILKTEQGFGRFAELFKDKFRDVLGLELEIQEEESENKAETTDEKS